MGTCINPGIDGFMTVRNGRYIDKSGLIATMNSKIDTTEKLICFSRPRRFGKTVAAKMLCAYYCKGYDSKKLFDDLEIANDPGYNEKYEDYLNRYNVICLDIAGMLSVSSPDNLVKEVNSLINKELKESFDQCVDLQETIDKSLYNIAYKTGEKFIAIIDEWDAPIRDSRGTSDTRREYMELLRLLFKNTVITDKVFAGVYMTGILPIAKDGSQSALSEFREYSMLYPDELTKYIGFTEEEVKRICEETHMNFDTMKLWYDGYSFDRIKSIYNPYAIMEACRTGMYRSYWKMTSAADSLLDYIDMDFGGLSKAVTELMAGLSVKIDVDGFQNTVSDFKTKDDVLTLLVHFGYLSFDEKNETVRIPNEEIRIEFSKALRRSNHKETLQRVLESDKLIDSTISMDENTVARIIQKIHEEETAPLTYNNEQALRGVLKLAYFSYKDKYSRFEELPSGKGYADLVYIPKRDSHVPALIIELKWNKTAEAAIDQIKDRNYAQAVIDYSEDILMVGINYDEKTHVHTCKIEKFV